jgi:hypothetical protein
MGGSLSGAARCMCSKLEKALKSAFLRLVHLMAFVSQDIDAGHFFNHGKDVWCIMTAFLW